MLVDRSSKQLTEDVKAHLEGKMVDSNGEKWDDELNHIISGVTLDCPFEPFTCAEVREQLQHMKCASAVGPDGISVHLLREVASHDLHQHGLVDLINHIVRTQEQPNSWGTSFLALLAKCKMPKAASDLRPICVSSAFHKLVSRLVCTRCLPVIRRGSKISCCGKSRQTADLIGSVSRMRDVTKEWGEPLLLCKLDIAGAFDKIDRRRVASLLTSRLQNDKSSHGHELRYLLSQLFTHSLVGQVPGGQEIALSPNIGIKQGAPESAEVFGLVIDSILSDLVEFPKWKTLGGPFEANDLGLLFFQDDIFILEDNMVRLAKRIKIIDRCIGRAGLRLATSKTKIVANCHYKGCRKVQVGEDVFEIANRGDTLRVLGVSFSLSEDASEQAKELIGRTRDALYSHADILRAPGPWMGKINILRSLVESQFAWVGGALHWSSADLHALNVLQVHACRQMFGLRRAGGEQWHEWNARSSRFVRVWLHNRGISRWSTRVLTLQHTLHGHWARQTEQVSNAVMPGQALRALLWRNTEWWRGQQRLSPSVSMRHPRRFYASNPERQLAQSHGSQWVEVAQGRDHWSQARKQYIADWDVPWCNGRQLSICY